MVDIDRDCNATTQKFVCPSYVATPAKVGVNTTIKENTTLPAGGKCTMTIDATQEVARVLIKEGNELGVLFNQYKMNEWITIPKGNIQEITVYNGKESGPLAFIVLFTSAITLKASMLLGTALLAYSSL